MVPEHVNGAKTERSEA